MSNAVSYTKWITITVAHHYFDGKKCCLDLEPDPRTYGMLIKAGMRFKQVNPVTWLIIKPDASHTPLPVDAGEELVFHLKNATDEFYYYTDTLTVTGAANVSKALKNGTWKTLNIPLTQALIDEVSAVSLAISSKTKIWEFILIPKYTDNCEKLELKEARAKLLFEEDGKKQFPGEDKDVFRFVSTAPVSLKEIYDYKISLWELKENGENLLSTALVLPKPAAHSWFSAQDTITSYFYF